MKINWKNLPSWLKGGIIFFIIWIFLAGSFYVSDKLIDCELPDSQKGIDGANCFNAVQEVVLLPIGILSLPLYFLGWSPVLTTVGPIKVKLFWFSSGICFVLWGFLFGWLYGNIKHKLNNLNKSNPINYKK